MDATDISANYAIDHDQNWAEQATEAWTSAAREAGIEFEITSDFDIDGLVNAYRAAINKHLDGTTIRIHGDDIYADYPAPNDWTDLVRQAFEAVDTEALVQQFDTTA